MPRFQISRRSRRPEVSLTCLAISLAAISFAGVAQAQDAGASSDSSTKEIVVTGTLLRNVAPAGAQTITLSPTVIESTGATSTDQLLASIPQNSVAFGNLQTVNSGGTQLTVNRINLRNLPQGIGGSSPTLVLLDGHRMVGEGVKQAYPDPDVIPPEMIERVEVITDGGSATYGSDAVGGVVNFITKRNFNGFKVGVRQGFANSYDSTDVNFTAGKSWDTGSVYVAYNLARHSSLFSGDRSYIRNINYATGLPTGMSCSPSNVQIGSQLYAVSGAGAPVLSNANLCDYSREKDYYPKETRHSVMAGFRQELSSNVEFEVKAFYSARNDFSNGGPLQGPSASVASTNPLYRDTGDANSGKTQTVFFDFAPVGGINNVTTKLWAYGITPSVTWNFGHDWRMKAFYNYGQSQTTADDPAVNTNQLQADVDAGLVNPYDIAASNATTNGKAAIGQLLNWTDHGIGKDQLSNARVTFDGPLFRLPGGDLKVAVGGEYIHEKFAGNFLTDTYQNVAIAPLNQASRNVKSAFGELNIPLVGPDNHVPLVYSFTVAAAERYDHYSDFGGNWAPNLGATWKPISWVSLRARWNRSFQAPSLVQIAQATSPQVGVFPGFFTIFDPALLNTTPGAPAFNGGAIVAVQGTVSPLLPQRARDYNLGFDISPPVVPGLNLHFTYYNINYSGSIGSPPQGFGIFYGVPTFIPLYQMEPTIGEMQNFLAAHGASQSQIDTATATVNLLGKGVYVVSDVRARNLGLDYERGYDFGFDYSHPVSFGSIDASFNGTYSKYSSPAADGVTFLPNQANIDRPRFGSVARVGATYHDNFRASLAWNHKSSFVLSAPVGVSGSQTTVGAFNTFDLFMKYDIKGHGLPPFSLSLGINNMFDQNPPLYQGCTPSVGCGYGNGSTIGRVVQLGASVEF